MLAQWLLLSTSVPPPQTPVQLAGLKEKKLSVYQAFVFYVPSIFFSNRQQYNPRLLIDQLFQVSRCFPEEVNLMNQWAGLPILW